MSDTLILWLPQDLDGPWHWRSGDRSGEAVTSVQKAALAEPAGRPLSVIFAGQLARNFAHSLPEMRASERRKAAGFAIEDKLAAPLSEQHVTMAAGDDKRIAVIQSQALSNMITALSASGLRPEGLYADFDALPEEGIHWRLPDRFISPGPLGYTIDPEWSDAPGQQAEIPDVLARVNVGGAINYLSGAFTPKRGGGLVSFSMLRRLGVLAVIAAAAFLALIAAQTRALNLEAANIRDNTRSVYTSYTGDPAPANPALTVTRANKTPSGGDGNFLALSSLLFRSIEKTEGIMVDTLQFDKSENQINLRLIYPSFESATQLEQAVKTSGGNLQAGGVRELNGRLVGDAVLKLGGGT